MSHSLFSLVTIVLWLWLFVCWLLSNVLGFRGRGRRRGLRILVACGLGWSLRGLACGIGFGLGRWSCVGGGRDHSWRLGWKNRPQTKSTPLSYPISFPRSSAQYQSPQSDHPPQSKYTVRYSVAPWRMPPAPSTERTQLLPDHPPKISSPFS